MATGPALESHVPSERLSVSLHSILPALNPASAVPTIGSVHTKKRCKARSS